MNHSKSRRRGNIITRGVGRFFKAVGEILSTIVQMIFKPIKGLLKMFFEIVEIILEALFFWW